MATFLFDQTIFGPVISRRLGVSLGINLLPNNSKLCSFDCIYCECGWNPDSRKVKAVLPSREFVSVELIKKLREMKQQTRLPDVITFAGNGEPTLHPHFSAIIDDTLRIRDEWAPEARIAVLSNSTLLFKSSVFASLKKVDDNILKLDSAVPETIRIMNRPTGLFDLDRLVKQLCRFEGKLVIQTMFLKGSFQGKNFDNTTDAEVEAWIELLEIIRPKRLMIYSIARDTPLKTLEKVGSETLKAIAQKVESRIEINVELA